MALKVTNWVYISAICVYTLFLLILFLFLPSMSYYFTHCPTLIQAGRLHKEVGVVDAGHSAYVEGASIVFIHARVLREVDCTQQKRRGKLLMTQIIWADSLTGPNLITGQLKISMNQREAGPTTELMIPHQGIYLLAWQPLTSMMHCTLQERVNFRSRWCFEVNVAGNLAFLYNAISFLN